MSSEKVGSDAILHPWSLMSIAVLFINDQYLKYAYTSWLTGKLSDFAGLVFFPLIVELVLQNRKWSVVTTGIGFAVVKLTVVGNGLYNMVYQKFYSMLGWGEMVPLVMDASDCLALVALLIPLYWIPEKLETT